MIYSDFLKVLASFQTLSMKLTFILGNNIFELVTNYGEGRGATKREVGHVKFYPYEKRGGGGGKSFSHSEVVVYVLYAAVTLPSLVGVSH